MTNTMIYRLYRAVTTHFELRIPMTRRNWGVSAANWTAKSVVEERRVIHIQSNPSAACST